MGNMISVAKTIVESSELSTTYATNGDISLNAASQVKLRSTEKIIYDKYKAPPAKEKELKKFLVHFRRPAGYKGEYGFDWLRDEYIYPLIYIERDNNNQPCNSTVPLVSDVAAAKSEYLKDVKNPVKPYGVDYYPAWLSLFPYTTSQQFKYGSSMNKDGARLDLELEEIEEVISDGTEIIFESKNPNLKITPQKINIAALMGSGQQTRFRPGGVKVKYYTLKGAVTVVSANAPLQQHEEIKVFAKLGNKKEEVGKLMVYNNHVIPKMELILVKVGTQANSLPAIDQQMVKDIEYQFKRGSYNQALIRAEIKTDTIFETGVLPLTDHDVTSYWNNVLGGATAFNEQQFLEEVMKLYEKYGQHKPNGGRINADANKRTYIFLTDLPADFNGIAAAANGDVIKEFVWGNAFVVFLKGLNQRRTLLHEAGHSLGLQHTFSAGQPMAGLKPPPYTFYQGHTDNIMDYTWQTNGNLNPHNAKDNMRSFFKFQWDIMRQDRSLILNY
ncbi:zinc-dependent metalloprotease [Chitinophaga sp. RCC_12]|uniref:zinc-dependent metalloprotease n=1 Tax=Chitinophaga sp. RCC_12 TaxID=3239226 RepID=UPI003526937C